MLSAHLKASVSISSHVVPACCDTLCAPTRRTLGRWRNQSYVLSNNKIFAASHRRVSPKPSIYWTKANYASTQRLIAMASSAETSAPASGHASSRDEPKVAIFTTPGCQYCKRAKEALSSRAIAYREIDVSYAAEVRAALKDITGIRTVPQIFLGGSFVGGSNDLVAALEDGSFDSRHSSAQGPALPAQVQELVERMQPAAGAGDAAASAGPSAETLAVVQYLRGAVPRSNVAQGLFRPRLEKVFTGAQLMDCLTAAACPQQAGSRAAAQQLAQSLLEQQLVNPVRSSSGPAAGTDQVEDSSETLYRLRADAAMPGWGSALNSHFQWAGQARDAVTVSEELRKRILQLYDRHLSADGRAVSYKAISSDPGFAAYVDASAELQRVDLSPLSREQLMALFINLYNALIIHATVVYGTKLDPAKKASFFTAGAKYNISGSDYSADDMENGVLRGNRPGAASLAALTGIPALSSGPFGSSDPRLRHIVSPVDPRIHFALVCGAKSCPPIKLYSAAQLEEGLAGAAEAFCQSEVSVDRAARVVQLSKIFKWYAIDFGADQGQRLRYIAGLLQGQARQEVEGLLGDGGGAVKVVYKEYDWSSNSDE